jgi:hypothetical protein
MKDYQISKDVTKTQSEKNNPESSEKGELTSRKSILIGEDGEKREGDEFIREGHGHDYSIPVASEDGGTEDQSDEQNRDMSKPTEQGKTKDEQSTI